MHTLEAVVILAIFLFPGLVMPFAFFMAAVLLFIVATSRS